MAGTWRRRAPAPANAALLMALLAVAAGGASALKCGRLAGGKPCPSPTECCSVWGFCGTGDRFCAKGRCYSGACGGVVPAKPVPKPAPKPAPTKGCRGECSVTVKQGSTARPTCAAGYIITDVPIGSFGVVSRGCVARRGRAVVLRLCLGKQSCAVPALGALFGGNPCPRTGLNGRLNLWIRWRCTKKAPVPAPKPKPSPAPKPKPSPAPTPGAPGTDASQYSDLWGKSGERWNPAGRLTDQSYAGYMANEKSVPNYPQRLSVRAFGAKGDGVQDDTAAFSRAIAAASRLAEQISHAPDRGWQNEGRAGVALAVPRGTYKLTQALEITQSNVVLRGAGPGQTTLYFPKPLSAIYGNKEKWATGGAFLSITGFNAGYKKDSIRLTPLTANARRGDRRIQVASTAELAVGSWIRIYALERYRGTQAADEVEDSQQQPLNSTGSGADSAAVEPGMLPLTLSLRMGAAAAEQEWLVEQALEQEGVTSAAVGGSLDAYLYGETEGAPSGQNMYPKADHIRFVSRVAAKGTGWIQLERPLNYDLRTHWKIYVYKYQPTVQHSGIESLTVRFAPGIYPSHHVAYGYNGLAIMEGVNCWIRNVRVVNADNGVVVNSADFNEIRGVELSVEEPRYTAATQPANGHHGLWAAGAVNTLFTNFNIKDMYMHDVTLGVFSENTVFANGGGVDLNIDFHRGGPHNNLVTNVNVGRGDRPWKSGGNRSRGAYSAANNTLWNVYAPGGKPLQLPACDFGPLLLFAGAYAAPSTAGWVDDGSNRRRLLEDAGSATVVGPRYIIGGPEAVRDAQPAVPALPAEEAVADALESAGAMAPYQHFPGWCRAERWWVELPPPGLRTQPADLHAAMVARRLGSSAG